MVARVKILRSLASGAPWAWAWAAAAAEPATEVVEELAAPAGSPAEEEEVVVALVLRAIPVLAEGAATEW